jgi:hypothetical protein
LGNAEVSGLEDAELGDVPEAFQGANEIGEDFLPFSLTESGNVFHHHRGRPNLVDDSRHLSD